jgi:transposase InsO family protein
MQLSTSSYYEYLKRLVYMGGEDDIKRQVISAFWRHKRRYGTRRIVSELSDEGYAVGRQRVRSILEDHGLRAIQPKAFVPRTTQTHPHLRRSPNLLLDREKVVECNQVWVGDITYLPLQTGEWAYLATWLDLYSRHIVGWDVQDHMEEELVISAFEKGITKRRPALGLITHSDGGGQYAGKKFRRRLQHYGYLQSMTRQDNHYDNAFAESLFSRIKAELLDGGIFTDVSEARLECFDYIECYYNPIRKHSSLGYKSPLQFEKECGC